jgi:hypothetical protein
MIRRTMTTAEKAVALDDSLVLSAVGGAVGALLLGVVVLLVVLAVRRRRATPSNRPDDGSGYSAGVARVPKRGDRSGSRAVARLFGRPERSIGLDVARGAALVALVAVVWFESTSGGAEIARRLADIAGLDPARGLADALARAGDATALCLVLISGVAVAFSSGGATPVEGVERLRCRLRLTVRAVVLLGIGGVAAFSGSAFAGLVATVGAFSLVALAVLGWRASTLFLAAVLWTVVVPALAGALASVVESSGTLIAPPLEWALSGEFPPVPLVGVFLAGLAVGRLDAARVGRRWIVFAAATGCAVLAFGAGAVVSTRLGDSLPAALSIAPGSAMPLALLGTGGAALALITLALIAGRTLRWVLVPLSAAGSMALTLWIASLAVTGAVWLLARSAAEKGVEAVVTTMTPSSLAGLIGAVPGVFRPTVIMAALAVLVAAACIIWRLVLGDGPVERLVRAIGTASTHAPERFASPVEEERPLAGSAFDSLIGGQEGAPETAAGASSEAAPHDAPDVAPPESRPVRRPTLGPVDPVTAATQWTPGQALGRLPY